MPAIQPARLRQQVFDLVALFLQPALFIKALHDLYFTYSDHTFRPGQESTAPALMPSYKLAIPVRRQVEYDLLPLVTDDPGAALNLADHLWADSYLEIRQLAVTILSHIPVIPPDAVLARFSAWAVPGIERNLLDLLFREGGKPFYTTFPDLYLELIDRWLGSLTNGEVLLGMWAVQALASDADFKNLPVLLRLISQVVSKPSAALLPDLQQTFETLAQRSPAETAHFLRHMIAVERTATAARLARRCLPLFDTQTQDGLRGALREASL
jgi:hypothetical protein